MHDATDVIRLACFGGLLVAFALAEALAPRRARVLSRWERWPANLGLVALNAAAVPLLAGTTAVGAAVLAQHHGWGLLHQVALPPAFAIVVAIVFLDLVVYLQHVMFHALPALWRLHAVHHSDTELDVTSGTRFHLLEIAISLAIKLAAIVLIGAPVAAVIAFEVLLNAMAMFNHANCRLPQGLDRVLRRAVVTPDVHRVHHSVRTDETNTNFGFNLSCWDRLFGTYRAQPVDGHEGMRLGLEHFRSAKAHRLLPLLVQPFLGSGSEASEPQPGARLGLAAGFATLRLLSRRR